MAIVAAICLILANQRAQKCQCSSLDVIYYKIAFMTDRKKKSVTLQRSNRFVKMKLQTLPMFLETVNSLGVL